MRNAEHQTTTAVVFVEVFPWTLNRVLSNSWNIHSAARKQEKKIELGDQGVRDFKLLLMETNPFSFLFPSWSSQDTVLFTKALRQAGNFTGCWQN